MMMPLYSYINKNKHYPINYLIEKVKDNDIVLLGEKHNQTHQLKMVISFIKGRHNEMPSTILALEIPTDKQNRIDKVLGPYAST